MVKEAPAFWVTNMCNRNVSLADLAVTIPAYRSVNLLDKKHYSYTLSQLQKSKENGSLFHKKAIISVRQVAPTIFNPSMPFLQETYIPSRERSTLVIKEEHYEELDMSDNDYKKQEEKFAEENADLAEMDQIKPSITTKEKL